MSYTRAQREAKARAQQEQGMATETETPTMTESERLIRILEQQALNQATQNERLAPRENPNYKVNSPNADESGRPWSARLKCDIYFGPMHLNKHPLLKSEVEALNRLQPIERGAVRKGDGTSVPASVVAKTDAEGRVSRLTMLMDLKEESGARIAYPSLLAIATTLADQAEGVPA